MIEVRCIYKNLFYCNNKNLCLSRE